MSVWLSVDALRNLLGVSPQAIRKSISSGKFVAREVESKGGKCGKKYEIALSSLPAEVQKKYLKSQQDSATIAAKTEVAKIELQESMDKTVLHNAMQRGVKNYLSLTGTGKKRADARTALLVEFDSFCKDKNLHGRKAVETFCYSFNIGDVRVEDWVKQTIPSVSTSTLYSWTGILKAEGAGSLAGKYGNRKGSGLIEQQAEVLQFLVCMISEKTHVSNTTLHKSMWARFNSRTDITLPSIESVGRWRKSFMETNAELMTAIANPDEWKNKFLVAYGDSKFDIDRPNQRWLQDSSPADIMLADGRHSLIASIDVFTGIPTVLVSKTSTAESICLLNRNSILSYGVPEQVKTDNGKDYASNRLALSFKMLGIEQLFSQPFSPWEKGQVERFFRTFMHGIFELLPGFVGHNVAEKKSLDARKTFAERLFKKNEVIEMKMTSAELQKFCDDWVNDIYIHEKSGGLKGKSPFQVLVEYGGKLRIIEDERVLDLLLSPIKGDGFSTVNKSGIRLDKGDYVAPELSEYAGKKVQVRRDPNDMGKIVVYAYDRPEDPFNPNSVQPGLHFVCIAINHRLLGINPQEVAAKARQIQKESVQKARKAVKAAARKLDLDGVVGEILAESKKQNSSLVAFPKQKVAHQSEGITAATNALSVSEEQANEVPVQTSSLLEVVGVIDSLSAHRPLFESNFHRASFYVEDWMVNKSLSGDDINYLSSLWRVSNLTYQMVLSQFNEKYGDNERYLQLKALVNW